ncbi:hypothetical protein SAMN02745196_00546 [Clostridium collagenovorans DSM 3089]|uniref:Uncharacterized protein n=1 Tax=Clostridium collagenovorans DSM 3089 TaxID=1121306 RepID=A0A1M5TEM3_9CLOT|nr:hypothetical protein [Clostridium collagenovorans]SHH49131.1 hypothetical protein SAMN02745196_00546 [Clostridium collagenovorans DSM 3089]
MIVKDVFDFRLEFSDQLMTYNTIRTGFINKAQEAKDEFYTVATEEKYNNKENEELMNNILLGTIEDYVIPMLIKKGIVSIDLKKFLKLHEKKSSLKKCYKACQRNCEEHKDEKKISLGTILSKPLKNEGVKRVLKEVKNNTDHLSKGIKSINQSIKGIANKYNIINEDAHMNKIANLIYEDIFNMHYTVTEIFNEYLQLNLSSYPNKEIEERIESRLNNIRKYDIESIVLRRIIKESLQEDPYSEPLYETILDLYGDANKELSNLAKLFVVDINKCKNQLLEGKFNSLDRNTEEGCKESKREFIKFANKLNVDNTKKYINIMEKDLIKFDIEFRTVEDLVFETREEASLAQSDKVRLDAICSKIKECDEEDLSEIRKDILDSTFKTKLYEVYIARIDEKLKELVEKREALVFEKLLSECNMKDANSVEELINYIESNRKTYKSNQCDIALEYLNKRLRKLQ